MSIENAEEVLGFNPVGKKRGIWCDANGETEYDLTPERARFILEHYNRKNRELSSTQIKKIDESYQKHGVLYCIR